MIHIFYVPGMFGSTVEYVLRTFTNEYNENIQANILPDGSMHAYEKHKHIFEYTDFVEFFSPDSNGAEITTIIYPFVDKHLPELLIDCQPYLSQDDKCILIHSDSLEYSELNMLCQYYKIVMSPNAIKDLDIYCNGSEVNITRWNPNYTHWRQMKPWEIREWLSMFYPTWTQEWINSKDQADQFFKVSTRDLWQDTEATFNRIIDLCGLTRNQKDLSAFSLDWRQRQDYIWQEYHLIQRIVHSIICLIDFSWSELNIISEAILQQQLRAIGLELQCNGVDRLPTNSIEMYKLLVS